MKVIVGLGNPGLKYRNTRHNTGFLVIKALASESHLRINKKGFNGIYGIGRFSGEEIILFKPLTYMNLSGLAVKAICASKLSQKDDLLVISDDINLPLGTIRIRQTGSHGGHNGLASIIENIGTDFARLRVGIASQTAANKDLSSYVLTPFLIKEKKVVEYTIAKAVECIEIWIKSGIDAAMNQFN